MRISDWSSDVCSSDLRIISSCNSNNSSLAYPDGSRQHGRPVTWHLDRQDENGDPAGGPLAEPAPLPGGIEPRGLQRGSPRACGADGGSERHAAPAALDRKRVV